jgi:hypothetical protein
MEFFFFIFVLWGPDVVVALSEPTAVRGRMKASRSLEGTFSKNRETGEWSPR